MKKKIFVVDDDGMLTLSVKQALEYYNPVEYDVVCIEDGEKCLGLLRANQIPDLILLDIMMPGMSGWMLSDRLRENPEWKNIPVVFLTARTDNFAKEASNSVCADYIEKPFDIKDLEKRISDILKKNISKSS
ncbi:MAG: chemotaxis protein CheY [Thermoplasmata archaeon M9B1D]|nr:MAG: chemotaxis protein CheY [Thermoplasmata archaeon M9B1D]PNX51844.1 MAG: chemotaxis protein CheY [Thermoplasmata archaeon M8B2D]